MAQWDLLIFTFRSYPMPLFMIDPVVVTSAAYAERECAQVRYRLPLLKHCFRLSYEGTGNIDAATRTGILAFFLSEASALAQTAAGDPHAYVAIADGASSRNRFSLDMNVFVVQGGWQTAWVHVLTMTKEVVLACAETVQDIRKRFNRFVYKP